MTWKNALNRPGIPDALGAALLFGAETPLAKWLLDAVSPWLLAGLLYLGSGLGLTLYRLLTRAPAVRLGRGEALWFAGAILAGGNMPMASAWRCSWSACAISARRAPEPTSRSRPSSVP